MSDSDKAVWMTPFTAQSNENNWEQLRLLQGKMVIMVALRLALRNTQLGDIYQVKVTTVTLVARETPLTCF